MERRSLGPMGQGVQLGRCEHCGTSYDVSQMTLQPNGRYACPLPPCIEKRAQKAAKPADTWTPRPVERSDDV